MSCFSSSYGSSLFSIQSDRASCLTLNFDDHKFRKSRRSRNQVRVVAESASCSYTLSARNVPPASVREFVTRCYRVPGKGLWATSDPGVDISDESQEDMASEKEIGLEEDPYGVAEARASRFTEESGTLGTFKDTIRESGSMLLYLPDAAQRKVALHSQQSEHGNILGHTTFSISTNWHLKTSPPLSFSSFLSSSSTTLKPLSAAFQAASPAISFTQRARVVTSSATKSPTSIGDTSVLSEEKIYLIFPNEATLANFLAKIGEDGLVKTDIARHPPVDTLDEASGKMAILEKLTEDGTIKIVIGYHPDMEILDNTSEKEDKVKVMDRLSVKMYEKRQTGEPGGRIQETFVPGYYGPLYAIISITGIFMVATTVPLVIALNLVEKQLCNSVNRFTDAQNAPPLIDNQETRREMVRGINSTSIKYALFPQTNQSLTSSVGEPLIRATAPDNYSYAPEASPQVFLKR